MNTMLIPGFGQQDANSRDGHQPSYPAPPPLLGTSFFRFRAIYSSRAFRPAPRRGLWHTDPDDTDACARPCASLKTIFMRQVGSLSDRGCDGPRGHRVGRPENEPCKRPLNGDILLTMISPTMARGEPARRSWAAPPPRKAPATLGDVPASVT